MFRSIHAVIAWISLVTIAGVASAQTEIISEIENNRLAFDQLERTVSAEYDEIRFAEVLEDLSQQSGLQFWIHESAVENNLDEDTLITSRIASTRLATVLGLMLQPHQCCYAVRDGVVQVMSEDAALDNLNLHVIDCRDLLAQIKPKKVLVRSSLRGGFGTRGGGGAFSIASPAPTSKPQDGAEGPASSQSSNDQKQNKPQTKPTQATYVELSPADQLIDVIQETVDPESWDVAGGSARLKEINGQLVILQTCANLRQIDILLDQLKQHD